MLDFSTENPTMFGDELWAAPRRGESGIGSGYTYNISGGATYTATPNLVIDANVGWVRLNPTSEMSNIGVHVGRDVLKLPGTNGQRFFEGGMPLFSISSYTGYGTTDSAMPYYRDNDQIQYVLNATWNKGSHSLRFGSDVSPASAASSPNKAEPSAVFTAGSSLDPADADPGGPSGNNFNSWGTFLLGLPTRTGRVHQVDDRPYTAKPRASLHIRDQWRVGQTLTLSFGTR